MKNIKILLCRYLVLFLTVVLYGCASQLSESYITAAYNEAIADASVIEVSEIITLPVITQKRLRLVTWTAFPESYPVGQETSITWGDVWGTLDNAVKSRCVLFPVAERTSDLKKLLGLPLDSGEQRSFVTVEVDSSAVFRPCSDPSLLADRCAAAFPENVSPEHAIWFAAQTAASYQKDSGYPWTRLGYTYNWKSGESEIGPAEFVIKKDSNVLTVSVMDTDSYCGEEEE